MAANTFCFCFFVFFLSFVSSNLSAYAQQCDNSGDRSDCGYVGINQQECQGKGCCWNPISNPGPWCFYPNGPSGYYQISDKQQNSSGVFMTLDVNGTNTTPFGTLISPLQVDIIYQSDQSFRVRIYDPNNERWEVPYNFSGVSNPVDTSNPEYSIVVGDVGDAFSLAVIRTSNNEVFFNSSGIDLQFVDQFLTFGTSLPPTANIYGLGERVRPLLLNIGMTYTMWNFDTPDTQDDNLYGSHPFYLNMDAGTNFAHGVFLRNSNGMDVVLESDQLIYKVNGGILDYFFFVGPSPADVVSQYTAIIGRPYMIPYWALGFHQCRYGYQNLQELEYVVSAYYNNSIPLDTMWTDIDYMDAYQDFTWDPVNFPQNEMNSFVQGLHQNGQHYVVIIDPGIHDVQGYEPYESGLNLNVFIKDANGNNFEGQVWPGTTVFPDFFAPATNGWWAQQISTFRSGVPVDGLWIDMNEISNFCTGECVDRVIHKSDVLAARKHGDKEKTISVSSQRSLKFDPNNPPYNINNQNSDAPLDTKTVSMDATHYGSPNRVPEYDAHNLFGLSEAIATHEALVQDTGVRPFVLSRSTWPSSGVYTAHWTGDNNADFTDLWYSIPGILSFNMFGIPFVGSDICGFNGQTTEELCGRWMELGAFYPFSRNHGSKNEPPHEPYLWPSVAAISRQVLGARYSILSYYYTLFYRANAFGETVARPLFFEFPTDVHTYGIDQQFLVGPAIMVSPVLTQGATSVSAYFPKANWYDFWTYAPVASASSTPQNINLNAPVDYIPVHIRGGSVIPMQAPALTSNQTRLNPWSLLVAKNETNMASGDVYIDDGLSLDPGNEYAYITYSFSASTQSNEFLSTVQASPKSLPIPNVSNSLTTLTFLGFSSAPNRAYLDNVVLSPSQYSFNQTNQFITFSLDDSQMVSSFNLTWV